MKNLFVKLFILLHISTYANTFVVAAKSPSEQELEELKILGEGLQSDDWNVKISSGLEVIEFAEKYSYTNSSDYVSLLSVVGTSYYAIADYDRSVNFYDKALNVQEKIAGKGNAVYVELLCRLGYVYSETQNFDNTIKCYKQALEIQGGINGEISVEYATMLSHIAQVYNLIGSYNKALEYQLLSLSILERQNMGDNIFYATELNNLGAIYNIVGDYEKALQFLIRASMIKQKLMGITSVDYAASLSNLAYTYNFLGDYSIALNYALDALKIIESDRVNNLQYYITINNNIGTLFNTLGDYEKALEHFIKSQKAQQEVSEINSLEYGQTLNGIGMVYISLNLPNKALEYFNGAIKIYDSTAAANLPEYSYTLSNIGVAYALQGNYKLALEGIELGSESIESIVGNMHPIYFESQINKVSLLFESKQYSKATDVYKPLQKKIRAKILSNFLFLTERERTAYWDSQMDFILPTYDLIKASDDLNAENTHLAYDAALFSKGLILASTIELRKVILESGDEELLEIFDQARSIERRLQGSEITREVRDSLSAQSELLNRELMSRSKEFGDFTRNLAIDWRQVQGALKPNDLAVEFVDYKPHGSDTTQYAALLLRKGWKNPRMIPLTNDAELNKFLRNKSRAYSGFQGKELYRLIWSKIEPYANEGENIYFSPSGVLHQMNIEILPDSEDVLVSEKYNLYRVSSTRELCHKKPRKQYNSATLYGGLRYDIDSTQMIAQSRNWGERDLYAISRGLPQDSTVRVGWSYLPNSRTEVDNIATKMEKHGISSTKYVEQVGTEESFKALSGSRTPIIHIATHGFFLKDEEAKSRQYMMQMMGDQDLAPRDNSMKRSGLILSGGQKAWLGESVPKGIDDGVLLSEEISTLDLRGTDLVVLSACDTALGEVNSEGVFGLQRAFKMAGVETIVMSLWQVSDQATSLMMQTFYDKLLAGKTKREAFIETQEVVKSQYPEPYYWASFIMLD